MTLTQPVIITPRLLPGVQIGNAFVAITYARSTGSRTRYRWFIDLPGQEFTGDDLQSGCQGGDLREGLGSLLSFLGAAAESYRYAGADGENANLFPLPAVEWAAQNSDEIGMAQIEVEENQNCIDE